MIGYFPQPITTLRLQGLDLLDNALTAYPFAFQPCVEVPSQRGAVEQPHFPELNREVPGEFQPEPPHG